MKRGQYFTAMTRIPSSRLAPSTGPSPRCRARGFTLVEIVVVLVVLGLIAGIAVPRVTGAKDKAYVAAMIADLHVASVYEEQYASENNGQYFSGTATAETAVEGFRTSKNIIVELTALTATGRALPNWSAVARHVGTDTRCELMNGVITCTTRGDWTTGLLSAN